MTDERKLEIVRQFKEEIYQRFNLNVMSDENLETVIEQMIVEKLGSEYITIEERVDIMERVYSSIRGLGILDSIIKDDEITEVMINGPKDIFIEKSGKLSKLHQTFDDEKQLEDIIQKIVGQAGREVNQANPIVDTRLPGRFPCECGTAADFPERSHRHDPKVFENADDRPDASAVRIDHTGGCTCAGDAGKSQIQHFHLRRYRFRKNDVSECNIEFYSA